MIFWPAFLPAAAMAAGRRHLLQLAIAGAVCKYLRHLFTVERDYKYDNANVLVTNAEQVLKHLNGMKVWVAAPCVARHS